MRRNVNYILCVCVSQQRQHVHCQHHFTVRYVTTHCCAHAHTHRSLSLCFSSSFSSFSSLLLTKLLVSSSSRVALRPSQERGERREERERERGERERKKEAHTERTNGGGGDATQRREKGRPHKECTTLYVLSIASVGGGVGVGSSIAWPRAALNSPSSPFTHTHTQVPYCIRQCCATINEK